MPLAVAGFRVAAFFGAAFLVGVGMGSRPSVILSALPAAMVLHLAHRASWCAAAFQTAPRLGCGFSVPWLRQTRVQPSPAFCGESRAPRAPGNGVAGGGIRRHSSLLHQMVASRNQIMKRWRRPCKLADPCMSGVSCGEVASPEAPARPRRRALLDLLVGLLGRYDMIVSALVTAFLVRRLYVRRASVGASPATPAPS